MGAAKSSNGGLIVTQSALATIHRELIVKLAARHRLPVVYNNRNFVAAGGLVSYGDDLANQDRLAAGYIDRILKGAKPADLPVLAPTKYELVINLPGGATRKCCKRDQLEAWNAWRGENANTVRTSTGRRSAWQTSARRI